jgi:hypothetical protein
VLDLETIDDEQAPRGQSRSSMQAKPSKSPLTHVS